MSLSGGAILMTKPLAWPMASSQMWSRSRYFGEERFLVTRVCIQAHILGGSSERYGCMLQSAKLAKMRWRLSASTGKEQVGSWVQAVGLKFKSGPSRVGSHSADSQRVLPS